ncbi:MAG: hypothetical protein ABIK68_08030 [bacterium]
MKKMGANGQKWLKSFHILFGCVWIGCGITLIVLQFTISPTDGRELYGIVATMDFIDLFILVPGAIGTLLTALIYSIWTNWGWFKHNWITVKWIICAFGIVFGTFWLGPWLSGMAHIAGEKGMAALTDPQYTHNRLMNAIFGSIQVATIIFAAFISVLKPWRKKKVKGAGLSLSSETEG